MNTVWLCQNSAAAFPPHQIHISPLAQFGPMESSVERQRLNNLNMQTKMPIYRRRYRLYASDGHKQYNMELYYMLTYYNIVRHTQHVAHIYRLPTRPLSMFVYVCAHELAILFFSLSFIVLYIWRNLRELYWAQIEHGNRSSDSEMVYHQGQPYTIVRCTLRTYINADDAQML